ncbi:MAG: alpha/beta hydrolase [Chloroflexota bacterium]|nr:alpha/beta hydrolase [Chloroflexota bacterium]
MPIVLVHGNPETDAIWDDLRQHLGRDDVVALSPPGFGSPVPDGFGATSDDYMVWLAAQLEGIQGPVDLVGHDWGGGHVFRLVNARPDLVRSWAIDLAGCFDPDYVWHDRAQVWQTPGAGEAAIAQQIATPVEQRALFYQKLGMSRHAAASCAAAFNQDMGRCILALYRSAAQPKLAEWGADLSGVRSRPGLVIIATEDHYTGGELLARRTAQRAGAQVAMLSGLGHWWMCQDPRRGADVLRPFVSD